MMRISEINAEGELRGQPANPDSLGKLVIEMKSMWRWKPNDIWLKLSDDAQSLYLYLVSMLLMYNYRLCLCICTKMPTFCTNVFYLDLLIAAFPAETPSRGRAYIRQKLNNADKIQKRKAKLTEAGN